MKRDFTQKTYDTLMTTIEEVVYNDEGFFDIFTDLWKSISSFFGILKCENYEGRIHEYHEKVIDQHNTTKSELDAIFAAVAEVDSGSADDLSFQNGQVRIFSKAVGELTGAIRSGMGNISSVAAQVDSLMATCNENVGTLYDKHLDIRTDQLLAETSKEFVGDVIGFCVTAGGFIVAMGTGDVPGMITKGWKLINITDAALHDADALINLGFSKNDKIDKSHRRRMILEAEESSGINSLKDAFMSYVDEDLLERGITDEDSWAVKANYYMSVRFKEAAYVSGAADIGVAVYDAYDSAKDVYENVTGLFEKEQLFTEYPEDQIFNPDREKTFLDKILTADEKSKVYIETDSAVNERIRDVAVNTQHWKNVKTIWQFIDTATDPDGGAEKAGLDTLFGYSDTVKAGKDLWDVVEKIKDCVDQPVIAPQKIADVIKGRSVAEIAERDFPGAGWRRSEPIMRHMNGTIKPEG